MIPRCKGRNTFFWILSLAIFIYGVQYAWTEGFFTDTSGKVDQRGRNGLSRSILLVHHNTTDSLNSSVDYVFLEKHGQSGERTSSVDKLFNEPRNQPISQKRMNVLFIMADDLRAQIGVYHGSDSEYRKPHLHTPNFDRLAGKSLLLKKAFVQYTFCGPSRTSMLTSRRPDITGVYDNHQHWRDVRGNYTSLPQYFKQHGYSVQGIGKLYHPGESSGNNDPISWTERYFTGGQTEYDYLKPHGPGERWIKVSPEEESDKPLPDRTAVKYAIRYLSDRSDARDQPFFLGVGFNKPHVSMICPQKFFDLYPEEDDDLFLSEPSWQTPFFRPGTGMINGTVINGSYSQLPVETLRHYRQAYFACISYVDDLLGDLLSALEELDLAESTIVSFIADHGYHLGEQQRMGKQSLYDSSSHVPMMIHIPGRTDNGIVSSSIVEALDIFPTIVEAAGLPLIQPCREESVDIPLCTEGQSILPLIDAPLKEIRPYAITQQVEGSNKMSFSIRSERYRFTAGFWVDNSMPGFYIPIEPNSTRYAIELYDHDEDKEERFNRANDRAYTKIRDALQSSMYEALHITQSE